MIFSFAMIKMLSILFICLCLLLSVSTACATVHIQSTCYNSEAAVTENVMTNNADYSSVTVLLPYYGYAGLPYSIRSDGAGKSVDEEFSEFSHSILAATTDDFEHIEANLKIESGEYEWKKGVTASYDGLAMGMRVECALENGNLEASYGNPFATHTEELTANGAKYAEVAVITPNAIASEGNGKSIKNSSINENPSNGSEDEYGGFSHMIHVEDLSQGKWAEITTYLTSNSSDTDYEWKTGAKTFTQNSSLGMALTGVSGNGSVETLGMDGEASKFPPQHLPPGKVVITEIIPIFEDLNQSVKDFREDFSTNPAALYYSIEQECHISPNNEREPKRWDSELKNEDRFSLVMSFRIGHT